MRPLRVRSLFLLLAFVLSLALTYGCAKARSDTSIPSAEGGVSVGVDAGQRLA